MDSPDKGVFYADGRIGFQTHNPWPEKVGANGWTVTEQNPRDHKSYSRHNMRIQSGSEERNKWRNTGENCVHSLNPVNRPISFGQMSHSGSSTDPLRWADHRRLNAPTGWMPTFPTGNSVRSWVEEVAYEAANNCGGDESVQEWVL